MERWYIMGKCASEIYLDIHDARVCYRGAVEYELYSLPNCGVFVADDAFRFVQNTPTTGTLYYRKDHKDVGLCENIRTDVYETDGEFWDYVARRVAEYVELYW